MPFFTQLFFQYPATESTYLIIKLHNEIMYFVPISWILLRLTNHYVYKWFKIAIYDIFDHFFMSFICFKKLCVEKNGENPLLCLPLVLAMLTKQAVFESAEILGVKKDMIHHCVLNTETKTVVGFASSKLYHPNDSVIAHNEKNAQVKTEKSLTTKFDKNTLKPHKIDERFAKQIAELRAENPAYANLSDKILENIVKGHFVKNTCLSEKKRHNGTEGPQYLRKTKVRLKITDDAAINIDEKKRSYWEEHKEELEKIIKEWEKEDKPTINVGIKITEDKK